MPAKHTLLWTVLILSILSCQTVTDETDTVVVKTGQEYFNETRQLIREPSDTLFWTVLNANREQYPEETGILIDEYRIYQKDLIRYFLKDGNPKRARFHFNNLKALPEQEGALITREMLEEDILSLEEEKVVERNSSLLSEGLAFTDETGDPVAYRDAVAVIRISYTWETDQGIERSNYDDMMGSGVLVSPRHVLTAFHVVDVVLDEELTEYSISVDFGEERYDDLELISWDSLTDLAVLELPEPVSHPFLYEQLKNDEETQLQGDTIYTHGHPYGLEYTFSKGVISSVERDAPEWGQWTQIDASIGPGSSGGLLLSQRGNVAGIVVAGVSGEDMNFAVPAGIIREVIDPMIDGHSVKRPWCGLLFGLEEEPLSLVHIFEDSPLAGLTVKRGDRLVAVNGLPVEDLNEAKTHLDSLYADNIVTLSFEGDSDKVSDFTFKMMRRPDYALYNKIIRMDAMDRLAVAAGVIVDLDDRVDEKIAEKNGIRYFQSFPVLDLEETGILYKRGIRKRDRLGVLYDQFKDERYKITLIHIPRGKEAENLEDTEDMIFTLTKAKYNEYIF